MSEQWKVVEGRVYTPDGGFDLRYLPKAEERAALIVKAVNNHEASYRGRGLPECLSFDRRDEHRQQNH